MNFLRKRKTVFYGAIGVLIIAVASLVTKEEKATDPIKAQSGQEEGDHTNDHEEKKEVTVTAEQLKKFDIQTLVLTKSNFQHRITFPGIIALNENYLTHIFVPTSGIVKEVLKDLGENTRAGDALATFQSRDMAEIKSSYISAHKNLKLQKDLFERDEKLWKQKFKAEVQMIQTRNAYENAKIALEQARQKLLALSMTESQIQDLPNQNIPLNIYTVYSPMDGKIIERHMTLGEFISNDKQIFVIANLDTVWINLAVPAEDLPKVKKDQNVEIFAHQGESIHVGKIMYVSPVVNEESRTGRAIIQLDNKKNTLHPGDFVKAKVTVSEQSALLSLPGSAIQRMDGKSIVFVKNKNQTFEARNIDIKGPDNAEFVEIMGGLSTGEEIAIKNTFYLKAELGKSEAEHSH